VDDDDDHDDEHDGVLTDDDSVTANDNSEVNVLILFLYF